VNPNTRTFFFFLDNFVHAGTGAAKVIISVVGGAMIAPKMKRPLFQFNA